MVKAILGAVFVDSSHSMPVVRSVMEALGFCFNQARDTASHRQRLMIGLQQLEGSQHTSRAVSPDCFNGPDCGCGCLWLQQYSSAGWYTPPLRDPVSRSSAQLSPVARSHSFTQRRYQQTVSRSSMERLKNWIVDIEPSVGGEFKAGPWIKPESSSSKEHVTSGLESPLSLTKLQPSVKPEFQ